MKTSILKTGIVLAMVVFLALSPSGFSVRASRDSDEPITSEVLRNLNAEEALNGLIDNGLELPPGYTVFPDNAERFVEHYLPFILDGAIGTEDILFNDGQSNRLLRNVGLTLERMGIAHIKKQESSRYTLVDSTVIGSWINLYGWYNCYSYAIGYYNSTYTYPYDSLRPGDVYEYVQGVTNTFSETLSVGEMADLVLLDLGVLNNMCYKTTSKPTSLPDQYFHVIALRKDTGNQDFHFMKMNGSLNSWVHKPGANMPLSWNYLNPGHKIWTNESVNEYGQSLPPSVTYESSIVYIVYKSYNDPGNQYQELDPIIVNQ